jgi:uncharacterized protein YbjT (DUF2867 family)
VKVHVTGGSGFTGAFVVRQLVDRGHQVFALARSERAAGKVSELGATPVEGDLDAPATLAEAFAAGGAEHLVNVASLGFGHADGIVGAAEAAGLDRAVFVSTTALFTKLNVPSKRVRGAAEDRIRCSSLRWTIIRPTMIYGTPRDRNIARLLQVLAKVPVVPVPGGGHRLQQPVHVEDLATAIVAALEREAAVGKAIDVPGPEPLSFRELLLTAGTAVGRRPKLVPVPFRLTMEGLRLYERVSSSPRLKAEQLERLGEDKAFDPGPAREILGYEPRPFSDGVRAEAVLLGLR